MGTKKKRVYINLVGNSSVGKIGGSKGRKGGRKPGAVVRPGGGRPGGKP
jgi:hypothetical protein